MDLRYLTEQDIESKEYKSFYEKYHGAGSFEQRRERIHWYFQSEGFKLLTASVDGRYIGQSCAYKSKAVVNGTDCELWWGCDGFVLAEMRGKGIGKALQKKLHEDCPNFSSASYSAVNGIIKKKCGGKEVLPYFQYYLPVSCYLSLYAELVLKKIVSRKCSLPHVRIPKLYYWLNNLWKSYSDYTVHELSVVDSDERISQFMEENLSDRDFHVKRSSEFLRWKYQANPSIRYYGLEIRTGETTEGVIYFSEPYNGLFTISRVRISKVLDAVVRNGSALTTKELYLLAVKFLHEKGYKLDGLKTLLPSTYYLHIRYPRKPIYMLSSYSGGMFSNGYLSLIDQDMEQMYEQ